MFVLNLPPCAATVPWLSCLIHGPDGFVDLERLIANIVRISNLFENAIPEFCGMS